MRRDLALACAVLSAACALRETPFVVDDPGAGAEEVVGPTEGASTAIRIGALFAFESRSSLTENNTFSGIELALREANAAGGVAGRPLEIVKLSFDGTAPGAETAAKHGVEIGL